MAKRAHGGRTELAASIAIDFLCGRFVDLALAFAGVDPVAAEDTLRIIEEESARALAELRDKYVKDGEAEDTLATVADLIGEMIRRAREEIVQAATPH